MASATVSHPRRKTGSPRAHVALPAYPSTPAIQIRIADVEPRTKCMSRAPLSFCPSSWNGQARISVATAGTVEIAAPPGVRREKIRWYARDKQRDGKMNEHHALRACLASNAARMSKGFKIPSSV